ncbi:hypothetical protein HH299_06870, partial [Xanthomonas sp. Kuri4-2]
MPVLIRILSVLLLSSLAFGAPAAARKALPAKAPPGSLEPVLAGEFALQAGEL